MAPFDKRWKGYCLSTCQTASHPRSLAVGNVLPVPHSCDGRNRQNRTRCPMEAAEPSRHHVSTLDDRTSSWGRRIPRTTTRFTRLKTCGWPTNVPSVDSTRSTEIPLPREVSDRRGVSAPGPSVPDGRRPNRCTTTESSERTQQIRNKSGPVSHPRRSGFGCDRRRDAPVAPLDHCSRTGVSVTAWQRWRRGRVPDTSRSTHPSRSR